MPLCPIGFYYDELIPACESCRDLCAPTVVADCKEWCAGVAQSTQGSPITVGPRPVPSPTAGGDVTSGDPFNWYIPVALATCIFIAATTLCVLLAVVVYVRRKKRRGQNRNSTTDEQQKLTQIEEGQQAAPGYERQASSSSSQCQTCQQTLIRVPGDAVKVTDDDIPAADAKDEGYCDVPRNSSTSSRSSSGSSRGSRDSAVSMDRSTSTSDIPEQRGAMEDKQLTSL